MSNGLAIFFIKFDEPLSGEIEMYLHPDFAIKSTVSLFLYFQLLFPTIFHEIFKFL